MDLIKIESELCVGPKPSLEPIEGVFIAGGAIRQWFVGKEPVSDVDVFGTSEEVLTNFVKTKLIGAKKLVENDRLESYSWNDQLIQVIHYSYYSKMEELLDSFDYNVCQFGWDGKDIYSTVYAVSSVLRGHLGVHKITKELAADSLRRAFKYQKKGYEPCGGTIKKIAESFLDIKQEQIDAQTTISPNGGTRILGVD